MGEGGDLAGVTGRSPRDPGLGNGGEQDEKTKEGSVGPSPLLPLGQGLQSPTLPGSGGGERERASPGVVWPCRGGFEGFGKVDGKSTIRSPGLWVPRVWLWGCFPGWLGIRGPGRMRWGEKGAADTWGAAALGRRRGWGGDAGRQKCSDLPPPPPHTQSSNPGRWSATPAPTPRPDQPGRLLRRRGLQALGDSPRAPFENGSISGYRALKGAFFLKGLVGKDKSGLPPFS